MRLPPRAATRRALDVAPPLDPIVRNQQLVVSTLEQYGVKSLQAAEAYIGLADAHREAKQYELAARDLSARGRQLSRRRRSVHAAGHPPADEPRRQLSRGQ